MSTTTPNGLKVTTEKVRSNNTGNQRLDEQTTEQYKDKYGQVRTRTITKRPQPEVNDTIVTIDPPDAAPISRSNKDAMRNSYEDANASFEKGLPKKATMVESYLKNKKPSVWTK